MQGVQIIGNEKIYSFIDALLNSKYINIFVHIKHLKLSFVIAQVNSENN